MSVVWEHATQVCLLHGIAMKSLNLQLVVSHLVSQVPSHCLLESRNEHRSSILPDSWLRLGKSPSSPLLFLPAFPSLPGPPHSALNNGSGEAIFVASPFQK